MQCKRSTMTVVHFMTAALVLCAALTSGFTVAADAVQARKDLKAMGTEYTEQDFAKVKMLVDAGAKE